MATFKIRKKKVRSPEDIAKRSEEAGKGAYVVKPTPGLSDANSAGAATKEEIEIINELLDHLEVREPYEC